MHIRSRGREVWSHPARLHVPRLTMYDPDFCGADQRELRCEWRQVDRNAKGQYLLHHKTAMEIAFVPIKAVELRIDGVTGYWFSHPSISTDSDGTITVTARRDPKGTYEVFASDDKLVSIAFSKPARDTSLRRHLRPSRLRRRRSRGASGHVSPPVSLVVPGRSSGLGVQGVSSLWGNGGKTSRPH